MNKNATTLEELGFNFDDNQHCEECPTGHCHDKAIGNLLGHKIPMYIHVSVHAPNNHEPCSTCEFRVSIYVSPIGDDPRDQEHEFDTEKETVEFLTSSFEAFKCDDW